MQGGVQGETLAHSRARRSYCTQLFELEKEFKDLSPEGRKKQRLEREKPILDAMLAWANTRNAAPKSALGEALTYLKNQ